MQGQNIKHDNTQQIEAEQQEGINAETVEQFNRVCIQATQLMMSYKQQSQDLKGQISSMVTMYNKTADPKQAVPLEKIMQITDTYEVQMRSAQNQYQILEEQLRKQQNERNGMMTEITDCFQKLQRMEKMLKAKKQAKEQAKSVEEEASITKKLSQ